MRQARFISPTAESSSSIYHIHSRCVDRVFKLAGVAVSPDGNRLLTTSDGGKARDVFVSILRDYAEFLGCHVLAFCVMSNHFHILLEVPPKKKGEPVPMSDELFLKKIQRMYSAHYYRDIEDMLLRFRKGGSDHAAEELKAKYTRRMYDLSEFMKGVKQRFTQWYNREYERSGTLWEGRFKSVLVEGGYAARVVSTYIDLNPVRAGMVRRPEDYRWSSYGMAMSGRLSGEIIKKHKKNLNREKQGKQNSPQVEVRSQNEKVDGRFSDTWDTTGLSMSSWARLGLCRVMELHFRSGGRRGVLPEDYEVLWGLDIREGEKRKNQDSVSQMEGEAISGSEWYRMMLYADGEEVFISQPAKGIEKIRVRSGMNHDEVVAVLERKGKLNFGEALRCKMRHFTDGMVFGSRDYVDRVFDQTRSYFGEKRKSGARLIRGVGWKKKSHSLYVMRDLKKEVITSHSSP